MAAFRSFVKQDGDSSGPSFASEEVDAFGRRGKKRPLYECDLPHHRHHNDGPPSARWKHENHHQQQRRRQVEQQPYSRRDGESSQHVVRNEPQHKHTVPRREAATTERIRYASSSQHHYSPSSSRSHSYGQYDRQRSRSRSSSSSHHSRSSHNSHHSRSPYDSYSRQHSRQSPSRSSSTSVDRRRLNGYSRSPGQKSGHPLFRPPAQQAEKKNSMHKPTRLGRSSSPLKKRWVPSQQQQQRNEVPKKKEGISDGNKGELGKVRHVESKSLSAGGKHDKSDEPVPSKDRNEKGTIDMNQSADKHEAKTAKVAKEEAAMGSVGVVKPVTIKEKEDLKPVVESVANPRHTGVTKQVKSVTKAHTEKLEIVKPVESMEKKPEPSLRNSDSDAKKRTIVDALDIEATPDLMEASSEEYHHGSDHHAVALEARIISTTPRTATSHDMPAGIVSESPHSVNHAEEDTAMQLQTTEPVKRREQEVKVVPMDKKQEPTKKGTDQVIENKQPQETPVQVVDTDSSDDDTSSSEDEEEILRWAQKMFGCTPPGLAKYDNPNSSEIVLASSDGDTSSAMSSEVEYWSDSDWGETAWGTATEKRVPPRFKRKKKKRPRGRPKKSESDKGAAEKKKRGRPPKSGKKSGFRKKTQPILAPTPEELEKARIEAEEARRVKAEAKPPTAAELKAILADDDAVTPAGNWVRRSVRQPSQSILTGPKTLSLLEKLKNNDSDMVVLKMKKYLSDPATPTVVIDAALDALEENTNCQSLYIQNFNIGMRDKQVLRLLKVLQRPSCSIWCLNIGETYNVKPRTWTAFANGLARTKITHMYASEHTITADQKEQIRTTIRNNRQKHDMHKNPDNLDVIIQCTHCWWNPVNTKSLRPYLQKRGFEHILYDKEKQGLRGSMSDAPTGNCDARTTYK